MKDTLMKPDTHIEILNENNRILAEAIAAAAAMEGYGG